MKWHPLSIYRLYKFEEKYFCKKYSHKENCLHRRKPSQGDMTSGSRAESTPWFQLEPLLINFVWGQITHDSHGTQDNIFITGFWQARINVTWPNTMSGLDQHILALRSLDHSDAALSFFCEFSPTKCIAILNKNVDFQGLPSSGNNLSVIQY